MTDCPGPLYPRYGKRPLAIQRTCDTSAGPHEDPLTASSGRPSERVTGRGPGVSSAPVVACHPRHKRGSYLLVPTHETGSPLQLTSRLPFINPLVGTKKNKPSRGTAPRKKTSPAANWRPPKSGDQRKTTGGYPATKGTDPETELNGHWCCAMATSGLHRSWCWSTHGVETVYTPCILCELHAPCQCASMKASCLSSNASVLAAAKNTRGRELLHGAPRQKPKRRSRSS